jgi:hypothetical protein
VLYPPRRGFDSFPDQLGRLEWNQRALPNEVNDVAGNLDYLSRDYQDSSSAGPAVHLFLADFPSQGAVDTIDSPKRWRPRARRDPAESSKISVCFHGHDPFSANRYVMARGEERPLVIDWYLAHDRPRPAGIDSKRVTRVTS